MVPALPKKATAPRAEGKGAKIIEMIGRAKGATLAEIMTGTDWRAHSVGCFLYPKAGDSTKHELSATFAVYLVRGAQYQISKTASKSFHHSVRPPSGVFAS